MFEDDTLLSRMSSLSSGSSATSSVMSTLSGEAAESIRQLSIFALIHNGSKCQCLRRFSGNDHLPSVHLISATRKYINMNSNENVGQTKQDIILSVLQGKAYTFSI